MGRAVSILCTKQANCYQGYRNDVIGTVGAAHLPVADEKELERLEVVVEAEHLHAEENVLACYRLATLKLAAITRSASTGGVK